MSLAQLFNQNSYTVGAITLLVVALVLAIARFRDTPAAWLALAALAIALVAGDLLFRVGGPDIEMTAQFDQVLAARQPVVLEIYSNY